MEIMICLPSINPMSITVLARYGEALHIRKVDLGFDHEQFSAIYDIEWYPEGIIWRINSAAAYSLSIKDFMIPDMDMKIVMFMLPHNRQIDVPRRPSYTSVLHMYTMYYKKYHIPRDKIELIINGRDLDSHVKVKVFSILGLLMVLLFVYHKSIRRSANIADGYHILDGDASTKSHRKDCCFTRFLMRY